LAKSLRPARLALLKADRIEGLGELLLAAFTVAARRRFSPTWSPAEIVRFVADVRSSSDEIAALLAPSVAGEPAPPGAGRANRA